MEQPQPGPPKPGFYKIISIVFLVLGIVLLRVAVVRHEWVFWAFAILTIFNAIVTWLKSLTPRDAQSDSVSNLTADNTDTADHR